MLDTKLDEGSGLPEGAGGGVGIGGGGGGAIHSGGKIGGPKEVLDSEIFRRSERAAFPAQEGAGFTVWERSVAHRLGIHSRDEMRAIRHELLQKGRDWDEVSNKVLWTPEAVNLVVQAVKRINVAPSQSQAGAMVEKRADGEEPGVSALPPEEGLVELVVVVAEVRNRQLVQVAVPGLESDRGAWAVCRVKDNGMFVRGMRVLGRAVNLFVYDFAGNPGQPEIGARLPRTKGRW